MFRRSTTRYGTTPQPVTPYQKAAQAWDERIGSARLQARNWRLMAFGSLVLSAGLGVGLVWQSARGTIMPWVVQVDHLGQAQVVAPATAGYMPADPQIAWYLAQFVHDVRALSSDPVVVRQNWLRSYDFTTTSGAQALNDYARLNDPFSRIGHEQVEVDIASVIRASPSSFRVAWTEHHYRDGAFTGTERWTAIVSVVLRTPRDADHLRKNPLGIYVSAINWSKELGQ
ncbi:conjugal transfer protein TrbF [Komagataeibacter europaeus]|uniref:conjugal transfer protein TrbF n=1 Tax=Komagataeibacter europaeus TaxID=33995 RepID=UPI0021568E8C|nr:conjugal transfer protein TrbF [Komagataeibacter europaeus]GBQ47941.1 conjugal transfer protein TrbF [Komagataeibacter europaeus LMG 18890]